MKTERRHELQHNELVQLLTQYHTQVKPYLGWMLAVVGFVLLVWLAFSWMGFSRGRQLRAGWSEYVHASKAGDVDGLRQVAARFPRTPAATRSLYMSATIGLHRGANRLLLDRAEGLELLDQARKDFEAALAAPHQDANLQAQTLLGLAQVFEATNELDKAQEQYQRVLDSHPDTSFALVAKRRLDFLNLADTAAFSDWFSKQKVELPPPAATSGLSPQIPSVHDDLPISSDLLLPDANALERSGTENLGPMIPPDQGEQVSPDDTASETSPADPSSAADPSSSSAPEEPNGSNQPDDPGAATNDDDPTPD
jgi:tetratricopeptide (TPR) repeat protein